MNLWLVLLALAAGSLADRKAVEANKNEAKDEAKKVHPSLLDGTQKDSSRSLLGSRSLKHGAKFGFFKDIAKAAETVGDKTGMTTLGTAVGRLAVDGANAAYNGVDGLINPDGWTGEKPSGVVGPHLGGGYKEWRRENKDNRNAINTGWEKIEGNGKSFSTDDETKISNITIQNNRRLDKLSNYIARDLDAKLQTGLETIFNGQDLVNQITSANMIGMDEVKGDIKATQEKILQHNIDPPSSVPCDIAVIKKGKNAGQSPSSSSAGGINIKICDEYVESKREIDKLDDEQSEMDSDFVKDKLKLDKKMQKDFDGLTLENTDFEKQTAETMATMTKEEATMSKGIQRSVAVGEKGAAKLDTDVAEIPGSIGESTANSASVIGEADAAVSAKIAEAKGQVGAAKSSAEAAFKASLQEANTKIQGLQTEETKEVEVKVKEATEASSQVKDALAQTFQEALGPIEAGIAAAASNVDSINAEMQTADGAVSSSSGTTSQVAQGIEQNAEQSVNNFEKMAETPEMGGAAPEWSGTASGMENKMNSLLAPPIQAEVQKLTQLSQARKADIKTMEQTAAQKATANMQSLASVDSKTNQVLAQGQKATKLQQELGEHAIKYQENGDQAVNEFNEKATQTDAAALETLDTQMAEETAKIKELHDALPQAKLQRIAEFENLHKHAEDGIKEIKKVADHGDDQVERTADKLTKQRGIWNDLAKETIDGSTVVDDHVNAVSRDLSDYAVGEKGKEKRLRDQAETVTDSLTSEKDTILGNARKELANIDMEVQRNADEVTRALKAKIQEAGTKTGRAYTGIIDDGHRMLNDLNEGTRRLQDKVAAAKNRFPHAAGFLSGLSAILDASMRSGNAMYTNHGGQIQGADSLLRELLANAVSLDESKNRQRIEDMIGKVNSLSSETLQALAREAGLEGANAAKHERYMTAVIGGLTAKQLGLDGDVKNMSRAEQMRALALSRSQGLLTMSEEELNNLSDEARAALLKDIQNKFKELDGVVRAVASGVPEHINGAIAAFISTCEGKIRNGVSGAFADFDKYGRQIHRDEYTIRDEFSGVASEVATAEAALANGAAANANMAQTALNNIQGLQVAGTGANLAAEATQEAAAAQASQVDLMGIFHHVKGDLDNFRGNEFHTLLHTEAEHIRYAQENATASARESHIEGEAKMQAFNNEQNQDEAEFADSVSQVEAEWDAVKRGWGTLSEEMKAQLDRGRENIQYVGDSQADEFAEIRAKRSDLLVKSVTAMQDMYATQFAGVKHSKEELERVHEESGAFHTSITEASKGEIVQQLRKLRNTDRKVISMRKTIDNLHEWAGQYTTNEDAWRQEIKRAFTQLNGDFSYDIKELSKQSWDLQRQIHSDAMGEEAADAGEVKAAYDAQGFLLNEAGERVHSEIDSMENSLDAKNKGEDASLEGAEGLLNGLHPGQEDTRTLEEKIADAGKDGADAAGIVDTIVTKKETEVKVRQIELNNKLSEMTEQVSSLLEGKSLDSVGINKLLAAGYTKKAVHQLVQKKHEVLLHKLQHANLRTDAGDSDGNVVA